MPTVSRKGKALLRVKRINLSLDARDRTGRTYLADDLFRLIELRVGPAGRLPLAKVD